MSEDVRYQGKGDGLNNDTYYAMKKKKVVEEEKLSSSSSSSSSWKRRLELTLVILYALSFYLIIIPRSIQLSNVNKDKLRQELRPGYMGPGWMGKDTLNDASDAQWRNFRGNLPLLSLVFAIFTLIAITLRATFRLKGRAMSHVWLTISLLYLFYLHGACVLFILFITSLNFLLVKMTARFKCFPFVLWMYNIFWLICNRIYNGYSFTSIGQSFAFLDNYRGTFWWHICFNFVVLRMISFGFDYNWAHKSTHFDQKMKNIGGSKFPHIGEGWLRFRQMMGDDIFEFRFLSLLSFVVYTIYIYQGGIEKHVQRCPICSSGKKCYHLLQERSVPLDKFSFSIYLCYLFYAPLYIAGPIISFNAFASQLDTPQKNYSIGSVAWYGLRWILLLSLMELMTHFCYFNAFVIRGSWTGLSPFEVFIIGYGVLNFMWLKFLLIWRYFRFWSLIAGIEAPENMPGCINNCYNLESFWKNWHASFNKWLVRYIYIPLGGYHRKELNLLVIFPFVAIWHELEWKLLLWAGLTCLFFKLEMQMKSASNAFQAKNAFEQFILREVRALTGAITITCLMVANLVGYVIGSDITLFVSKFLHKDGLPVLGGMFATFYVGTKLMFYIQEAKERRQKILETTRY